MLCNPAKMQENKKIQVILIQGMDNATKCQVILLQGMGNATKLNNHSFILLRHPFLRLSPFASLALTCIVYYLNGLREEKYSTQVFDDSNFSKEALLCTHSNPHSNLTLYMLRQQKQCLTDRQTRLIPLSCALRRLRYKSSYFSHDFIFASECPWIIYSRYLIFAVIDFLYMKNISEGFIFACGVHVIFRNFAKIKSSRWRIESFLQ